MERRVYAMKYRLIDKDLKLDFYSMNIANYKEKPALIFIRRSLICVLIKACPPSVVTCVTFKEAVALVVLVPNVEGPVQH